MNFKTLQAKMKPEVRARAQAKAEKIVQDITTDETTTGISLEAIAEQIRRERWYHDLYWWIRYGIWQWLRNRPRRFRSFFQRGLRGWADEDTWSFDHYLSRIIPQALMHLKANQWGYPGMLTAEQWGVILDDIIFTFQAAEKIMEDEWFSPHAGWASSSDGWTEEWYAQWALHAEEWTGKFDIPHRAMTKEECERYERGWKLFQQYFYYLWD